MSPATMKGTPRPALRLAVVTSHPIQYYAPLFAELAKRVDLMVFFGHQPTPEQQSTGFGVPFQWDVDLTSGYPHAFLTNVAKDPNVDHFAGCDTPGVGQALADGGFDAVLIFGWRLKSSLQAAVAARRMGLPVLMRGDSQLSTPRSALMRMGKAVAYPVFLRLFSAACYVGSASKAYYEHYHYPKARLFSSPHCVDTAWFSARATPAARSKLRRQLGMIEDEKLVLFAGKLAPFKRPLDVVEAVARLRSMGVKASMLVAGAGELESEIRGLAQDLGVPLHMLGFQNQSQMPAAYAAADVLMLPSDGRETWGLVCNEALACGCPILVSSAAGCAQDLAGAEVGGVFPLGDLAAAADSLTRILRQPPSPAALAARSAAFGLETAADGIVAAMKAVTTHRDTH